MDLHSFQSDIWINLLKFCVKPVCSFIHSFIHVCFVLYQGQVPKQQVALFRLPRVTTIPAPASLFFFNFFNIYLFLRDREKQSASEGGAERDTHTESKAGFRLWAVSTEPHVGPEPTNWEIMSWGKVRWLTNWLSHPGAPGFCLLFGMSVFLLIWVFYSFFHSLSKPRDGRQEIWVQGLALLRDGSVTLRLYPISKMTWLAQQSSSQIVLLGAPGVP